jgi:hypothetical protein
MDVMNNDLIKMASFTPGNCATVPASAAAASQRGGSGSGSDSAATVYGLQSYSAGYDLNKPVELPGGSAHYLDWTAYDNTCKGGARRSRSRKQKKARKSQRKQSRRSRH